MEHQLGILVILSKTLFGIVECVADCSPTALGDTYSGHTSTTQSGKTCQRWDSQSPHTHVHTYIADQENYCRNPASDDVGLWCYTTDPNVRWEICKVPLCAIDCMMTPLGNNYRGQATITESGKTCQRWDSQSPHSHTYTSLEDQENYCRNPDNEGVGPWCYTTDPNVRWQSCYIPVCECKMDMIGFGYSGYTSVTISGIVCQRWDRNSPHQSAHPQLADQENYCRNPDAYSEGPWCYTTDRNIRWELCDIPICVFTTTTPVATHISTATTGVLSTGMTSTTTEVFTTCEEFASTRMTSSSTEEPSTEKTSLSTEKKTYVTTQFTQVEMTTSSTELPTTMTSGSTTLIEMTSFSSKVLTTKMKFLSTVKPTSLLTEMISTEKTTASKTQTTPEMIKSLTEVPATEMTHASTEYPSQLTTSASTNLPSTVTTSVSTELSSTVTTSASTEWISRLTTSASSEFSSPGMTSEESIEVSSSKTESTFTEEPSVKETTTASTHLPKIETTLSTEVVTETTSFSTDVVTEEVLAVCSCPCSHISPETLENMANKLRENLSIDKRGTSKFIRRHISVKDNRKSSRTIGTIGIAFLIGCAFLIVLSDCHRYCFLRYCSCGN